jgi:lysozyme
MARTPPKTPALIALAVLISAPLTAKFEGLRTHPYHDPGDGRLSVCYGETEREMRSYTADECLVLLRSRQANDYAPAIAKCVPALPLRTYAYAASIDASYNAGVKAFCKSRMAKAFRAGDYKAGCEGFVGWYETAGGKRLPGLARRRIAERSLCMKSL